MKSGTLIAVATGGVVAGAVAFAQATPTKDEFIAVMEQAKGCFVAEKDAAALFVPLGFTQDLVRPWVDELVRDRLATVNETGLTLKTEKCH